MLNYRVLQLKRDMKAHSLLPMATRSKQSVQSSFAFQEWPHRQRSAGGKGEVSFIVRLAVLRRLAEPSFGV